MSLKNKPGGMEHLFKALDRFGGNLAREEVILFLDYDGTLTPIVKTPPEAVLSKRARSALGKLSATPGLTIAVISGRSLKDVKKLVGLRRIIYVGNHGLEVEGPRIKYECFIPRSIRLIMRRLCEEFNDRLSALKGVFVEDKGLTLSVHYRLADSGNARAARKIVSEIVRPYLKRRKVRLNSGKKVVEIKPAGIHNKGKAVLWLLARQISLTESGRVFPVYMGDDTTDEDAFKALGAKGLTVFVGGPKFSYAKYYLRGTSEAITFLGKLSNLRRKANG